MKIRRLLAAAATLILATTTVLAAPAQSVEPARAPDVGSCWMFTRSQLRAWAWPEDDQVPCTNWHTLEVTGVYWMPPAVLNRGRNSVAANAYLEKKCLQSIISYQGSAQANLGFHNMYFISSRHTWDAGGTWGVCGGTPRLWVGSDIIYGMTSQPWNGGFFAPLCNRVTPGGGIFEVRCNQAGARPYTRKPLSFQYLELMKYPGRQAVLNKCRSMAGKRDFYCAGLSRSDWNEGWRYVEIMSKRPYRGRIKQLNIRPI